MSMLRVILPVLGLGLAFPVFADDDAAPAAQTTTAPLPTTAPATSAQAATTATVPPRPVPGRPQAKHESFNDLVRNLVAAHEVLPLKAVLDVARKTTVGEVVSIKLHRQKNRWIYHVRLLKPDGRREELDIDGKTSKILERK